MHHQETLDTSTALRAASRLLRAKALRLRDESVTARSIGVALLGHSGGSMTWRYVHPTMGAMREAVEKLEQFYTATDGSQPARNAAECTQADARTVSRRKRVVTSLSNS
jgi:hypothetical protein